MQDLSDALDNLLKENTAISWLLAISLAMLITFIIRLVLTFLARRLSKLTARTESQWDDLIVDCLLKTRSWFIYAWVVSPLLLAIKSDGAVPKIAQGLVVVASCLQACIWAISAVREWKEKSLVSKVSTDNSSLAAIGLLTTALQGLFIVGFFLIGLSNLGVDIAALLAGLGVGGIAVALAAQNVLGDLLASLSIVLDKPFVIGDFIVVGNEMGTVENIGIKTTRVRSLSGEELVFSNKDLLESRVHNFKRMFQRRIVKKFGVTYSTPSEKIANIPGWIKEIFEQYPDAKLDRCNFADFGSSSLDFEYVFMVLKPDYNAYMDLQEKVLLDIMRKFDSEEVEFAFPTQTLIVESLPPVALQQGPKLVKAESGFSV